MSRGSTEDQAILISDDEVIDLDTPSPPGSRTASRAPPSSTVAATQSDHLRKSRERTGSSARASAATQSDTLRRSQDRTGSITRASATRTMGVMVSKPVSGTDDLVAPPISAGSSISRTTPTPGPIMAKSSSARTSRARRRSKESSNVSSREPSLALPQDNHGALPPPDDPMDIDQSSPPPQIKISPQSVKRKHAEVEPAPQLNGFDNVPMVVIPSTSGKETGHVSSASSKRPSPHTDISAGSNHQQNLQVKISPHSLPIQQRTNTGQPENESGSEHDAEPAVETASPQPPSQSDDEEDQSSSPSPAKRPRISTRSTKGSQASTISSSSPLVPRLKARKQRGQVSTAEASNDTISQDELELNEEGSEEQPSLASFTSTLCTMNEGMQADHTLTTRHILQKAREQSASAPPIAVDKVSPFASMKSIQMETSTFMKSGSSGNKFASMKSKKKDQEVEIAEPMHSWVSTASQSL